MSRALQTALLPLLGGLLFVVGPVQAGPGGNRNGDPDHPQGTIPGYVEGFSSARVDESGYTATRTETSISDAQRFLIRMYLRWLIWR